VLARKVQDSFGTRPNLYCVAVAKSGYGKDASRTTNKDILYAAGADILIGPEGFASGPGVISAVESQPALLSQIDEFGRVLRTLGNPASSPWLYAIITNLLKLFTSAGTVFKTDSYADPKKNKTIDQPSLTVFGSSTPDSFLEGLTTDSVAGGLLGRCLIFEAPPERPPARDPDRCEPSPDVIDFARQWFNFIPCRGNLTSSHPRPWIVPTTPDARKIFGELSRTAESEQDRLGEPLSAIWARSLEKAHKLALILACSRNVGERAEITADCAAWACTLVEYLTRRLVFLADGHVAENQTESTLLRIRRLIQSATSITQNELTRKTRSLTIKDRQEALNNLITAGDVAVESVGTGGRPTLIYKFVG